MSLTRINKTGEPQGNPASDGRLTISIPIQIKRRGGRKLVTLPNGGPGMSRRWDSEPTPLQLALARGYRWLAMLESGEHWHAGGSFRACVVSGHPQGRPLAGKNQQTR